MMQQKKTHYYREVAAELKQGKVDPAYLLYGEEVYLVDDLINRIAVAHLGKIDKEINYFVRYASDLGLPELLALMSGGGLFSEKKLIVYKDYQLLRNPKLDRLIAYLKNPNPDIRLILSARTESINQARYKNLQGLVKFVNLTPLRDRELQNFIRDEFKRYKKEVSPDGVQSLLYLVGEQIHNLKVEIAQVAYNFPEKTTIEAEDIEAVVGVHATQSIFQLTRAIGQKKLEESIFLLHNLLGKGENPGAILFLLTRHIMILLKIQGFQQSGERNQARIMSSLRLYSKQFSQFQQEMRNWNRRQLFQALEILREADQTIKNSQLSPEIVLDKLMIKLTGIS